MAINVDVAAAAPLDSSTPNALLVITFTNTAAFTYAASSKIYYYVFLTDSTSATREITFVVSKSSTGTIDANTSQIFAIENNTNLDSTITTKNGRICYVPQT